VQGVAHLIEYRKAELDERAALDELHRYWEGGASSIKLFAALAGILDRVIAIETIRLLDIPREDRELSIGRIKGLERALEIIEHSIPESAIHKFQALRREIDA